MAEGKEYAAVTVQQRLDNRRPPRVRAFPNLGAGRVGRCQATKARPRRPRLTGQRGRQALGQRGGRGVLGAQAGEHDHLRAPHLRVCQRPHRRRGHARGAAVPGRRALRRRALCKDGGQERERGRLGARPAVAALGRAGGAGAFCSPRRVSIHEKRNRVCSGARHPRRPAHTLVRREKSVDLPPPGVPATSTKRSASPPRTTALTRCHASARASSTTAACVTAECGAGGAGLALSPACPALCRSALRRPIARAALGSARPTRRIPVTARPAL